MQNEYDEYKRKSLGVWNIKDKDGKIVDTKYNDELPKDYKAAGPLRKNAKTGQWEAYPDTPVININKKTGDILVNAPKDIVNSETFQNQLKPVLTQLSANYKLSPDYKYALTTDSDTAKTTEEWVKDVEKDLPTLVSQARAFESVRDEVKEKAGIDLSDEDIILMNQVTLDRKELLNGKESVVKVKDSDRQAIPDKIANLPAFKGRLEGYDAASKTTDYKSLNEAWDRKEYWSKDKIKDDEILEVFRTVQDYFEAGDFSDHKEYAAMVAFSKFIEGKDPGAGFFKGTGTLLWSIGHGILTGAADFDTKVGQVADWLYKYTNPVGVIENIALSSAEQSGAIDEKERERLEMFNYKPSRGIIGGAISALGAGGHLPGISAKNAPDFNADFLAKELDDYAENTMENYAALADGYGSGYVLAKEITPIAMQAAVGNAAGAAIKAGVLDKATKLVSKDAMEALNYAEAATGGLEKIVGNAVAGTEIAMTLSSYKNMVDTVSNAIKILQSAEVVGTVADLGAQIVVDTVMTNPDSFKRFMSSDATAEDKQYIAEQIGGNLLGWGIGVGASKAVSAIGKTKVGKIASTTVSKHIYSMKARIGNYVDNLKTAIHAGDPDWLMKKAHDAVRNAEANPKSMNAVRKAQRLQRKRNVSVRNRVERKAFENIGKEDSIWKDISKREGGLVDTLYERAIKQESKTYDMLEKARWVEAATTYHHSVEQTLAELKANASSWSKSEQAMVDSYAKILKLSNAVEHGGTLAMPQDVSNYINAKQYASRAVGLLNTKNMAEVEQMGLDTKKINAIKKNLASAQKIVDDFVATSDAELVSACDDFYDKLINATLEQNNAFINSEFPVLNENETIRLRGMERFKEGYFHQERIHSYEEWLTDENRGALLKARPMFQEHQSMTWEGDENWADPFLAYMIDQQEFARRYVRTRAVEGLKGLGFEHEVMATGEDSIISERIDQQTRSAVDRVRKESLNKSHIETAIKDIDAENKTMNVILKDLSNDINAHSYRKSVSLAERRFNRFVEAGPKEPTITGIRDFVAQSAKEHGGYYGYAESLGLAPKTGLKNLDNMNKAYNGDISKPFEQFPKGEQHRIKVAIGKDYDKYEYSTVYNPFGGETRSEATELNRKNLERFYAMHHDEQEKFWETYFKKNIDEVWEKNGIIQDAAKSKYAEDIINSIVDHSKKYKRLQKFNAARVKAGLGEKVVSESGEPILMASKGLSGIDQMIDELIDTSGENLLHRVIGDMNPEGIDLDTVDLLSRYYMVDGLKPKDLSDAVKKEFDLRVDELAKKKGKKIVVLKDYQAFKKKGHEYIDQAVKEQMSMKKEQLMGKIHERGFDEFIGEEGFFKKVDDANRNITNAKRTSAASGMVWTYADNGRVEYIKISPTIATMFAEQPINMKHGMFWHLQRSLCNIFRISTTGGLIPASLTRQWSRDTGNALVQGDAWLTNETTEKILTEVFGDQLADEIRVNSPDVWNFMLKDIFGEEEGAKIAKAGMSVEDINKASAEGGEQLRKAAVAREQGIGRSQFKYERESRLYDAYQDARIDMLGGKSATGRPQTLSEKISKKINDFTQKTEYLNNAREDYLRERVYQNNFVKALDAGHSVNEARNMAKYISAEATTNFSRQTYYLNQLSETVPYLRSAINGSKSFWSLVALDPVGITTRLVGGYVIPIIALTNLAFSNENDARIYKNIPEYEKEDNMVFVLQGTIFKIPIPQELATFVTPIQHMVEKIHGMNDKSTMQLMLNDLVGFSPIDLTGFVNVDADQLIEQDILHRNLLPGVSKMASQMLPPLAKAGIMRVTGVDPYTMKKIDTSWVTIDPDTGEAVPMDYNSGEFAKCIAKIFSGVDSGVSPAMAQAIMENLIGKVSVDVLNRLAGIGYGIASKDKGKIEENAVGLIADPLTSGGQDATIVADIASRENYQKVNAVWNRAVRTLEKEKNAILNDKEYQALASKLNDPSLSEQARLNIKSKMATKREEYQNKVLSVTENLINKYHGTFDKNKYAAVINLMMFEPRTVSSDQQTNFESDLSSKQYYLNRTKAVETMAQMGFSSPNDYSIFGYYHTNKDGSVEIRYNSPTQILAFGYGEQEQNELMLANVTEAVNDSGLWDAHKAVQEQISALYDTDGKPDYNAIAAIQINWNAEVARALAPLMAQYSPQALLSSKRVKDYLYSLIEVPGDWEVNDYGKHMSRSKLGSRGNKKSAYFDSWFRRMFNINDKYKGPAR